MTKKKWTIVVGIALSSIVGVCFWSSLLDPARRPDSEIRSELLQLTPLGTGVDEVHEQLRKRFSDVRASYKKTKDGWAITYISVQYGAYRTLSEFPWVTLVNASWTFDEKGKLKMLNVYRGVDTI